MIVTLEDSANQWRAAMLEKLIANAHKPGWLDDNPSDLLDRVFAEFRELELAVRRFRRGEVDCSAVRAEAADVANMAMMVADACAGTDASLHLCKAELQSTPMEETQQEIMSAVDDAGTGLSPAEWLDFLQSLQAEIEVRIEGVRCDMENEDG